MIATLGTTDTGLLIAVFVFSFARENKVDVAKDVRCTRPTKDPHNLHNS